MDNQTEGALARNFFGRTYDIFYNDVLVSSWAMLYWMLGYLR